MQDFIKQIKKDYGFTNRELAEITGYSFDTISSYSNGRRSIKSPAAKRATQDYIRNQIFKAGY